MTTRGLPTIAHGELPFWATLSRAAASFYLQEPEPELLGECARLGRALAGSLPDESFPRLLQAGAEEALAETVQEFYDLFFVPTSGVYILPFEAAQVEKGLASGISREVQACFRAAGFAIEGLAAAPYLRTSSRQDYIGFELAFLAELLGSAAGLAEGAPASESLWFTAGGFCRRHLAPWLAGFADRLSRTATTPLYRGCGGLTLFLAKNLVTDLARTDAFATV